jgi:hypothetical protein
MDSKALAGSAGEGNRGERESAGRGKARGEGKHSYDPSLAEVVSGEVLAVKDVETKSGKMNGAGLQLATSGGQLLVFLGPHIYVDLQNIRISAGDKVAIKGVKIVTEGQILLVASEVRRGNEVLKLRDDKGLPLWGGDGSGPRGGRRN